MISLVTIESFAVKITLPTAPCFAIARPRQPKTLCDSITYLSMSEEPLVKITFDGSMTGEFDEATTKKRFQALFRLQKNQVERLFSGKSYTIKKNLTEPAAMDMAIKIANAGCECVIEPMPDENDLSLQEGFVERRRIGNRRLKFRRGPRAGAIVPDRRTNNGRRKTDPHADEDIYALD